jgi:hypothetical protein
MCSHSHLYWILRLNTHDFKMWRQIFFYTNLYCWPSLLFFMYNWLMHFFFGADNRRCALRCRSRNDYHSLAAGFLEGIWFRETWSSINSWRGDFVKRSELVWKLLGLSNAKNETWQKRFFLESCCSGCAKGSVGVWWNITTLFCHQKSMHNSGWLLSGRFSEINKSKKKKIYYKKKINQMIP